VAGDTHVVIVGAGSGGFGAPQGITLVGVGPVDGSSDVTATVILADRGPIPERSRTVTP
jgi:hypothetical protein